MRVLIVEDDPAKANSITRTVEDAGVDATCILIVPDFMGAKEALKTSDSFQLLVVDIWIPIRYGEGSRGPGGPELLRWYVRRNPGCTEAILAVTGYELDPTSEQVLDELGIPQVRYRSGEDKWQRVIAGVVRRLLGRKEGRSGTGAEVRADFVLQTTVDIEFEAVCRTFGPVGRRTLSAGETWCQYSVDVSGESRSVIVSQGAQMGMPAAAVLAGKAIHRWKPRAMLMVGICAGVQGEADIGDIVVADPAWDYGSGKLNEGGLLRPDPRPIELRESVRSLIKHHGASAPFDRWLAEWPAKRPRNTPRLLCMPAASGAAVLADGTTVAAIKEHSRKLSGVEMETYGFYFAVAHSGLEPCPRFASIKSVVDFADVKKGDDYQAYGAYVAAKFTRWIVEQAWGDL